MATLTADQVARAGAWATVFNGQPAVTVILDDLTVFVNSLPESQQAGAAKVLMYILLRRSQLRRQQRKDKARG